MSAGNGLQSHMQLDPSVRRTNNAGAESDC